MTEITSFSVETNFKPNSIKASWSLSGTLQVDERVIIRRALTTYPKTPDEGTLVLDSTADSVVTLEDNDLEENRYFYYTIFIKDTSTGLYTEQTGSNIGFALSYKDWQSANSVYQLFPEETKALDEQGSGDLNRLCLSIGNMMDLYRSEVFVMEYNRKPDKAPDNLLDFFSESFGFPAERGIDLNTLRRIGEGIVSVYKRKGTIPGIQDFIKLFTEFDSKIIESDTPNFLLYDDVSELYRGTLTSTGINFATDSTQNWAVDQWLGGTFQDQDQIRNYRITSNSLDTLQLNSAPPAIVSDSGTIGQGLDDTITDTAGNLSPVTGTASGGQVNELRSVSLLGTFPDQYWNLSYCIITSGANAGLRQIVNSFDSDTGTLTFDGDFPAPISVGVTFSLQRYLHVYIPGLTGLDDHELAGRLLTVTAGTNLGQEAKIARNWEFDGGTQIVLSIPFTLATDNTSDVEIADTGIFFQDTSQSWTPDEWRGYKITIDGTDTFNIVTNNADTLQLSPVHNNQGSPETYQFFNLADNYPTATHSYDIYNQYFVANGTHRFMVSDLTPPSFYGTSNDPGQFLFGGTTRSIASIGGVGEFELPIVILGAIVESGRSTDITVSTLTDSSANFPVNGYVGYKLNPNDQQILDFEIVSNTATQITVVGNITLVAQTANNYYIINKSNSAKTTRLHQTISQFMPYNLKPIITHEFS